MLAARDQENLAHRHRTAAAAKPLNQQTSKLAPKTPSAKPVRVPLNDENRPGAAGRSAKNGAVNKDGGSVKGKEAQKASFVTPSGPWNRAVLGTKTTNAKARAFQTPAAPLTRPKVDDGTPSMYGSIRRSKIKIATPAKSVDASLAESLDDVPDVEYMPPPEIPLPDHDTEVWPYDLDMSVISPESMERLRERNLLDPKGPGGLRQSERTRIEHQKALERECIETGIKAWDSLPDIDDPQTGKRMTNPFRDAAPLEQKMDRPQPSTLKAKSAASALSQKPTNAKASSTALAKKPAAKPLLKSKLQPVSKQMPAAVPQKTTRITGKHTLGYNLGRTASSNLASHRPSILPGNIAGARSRRNQLDKENDEVVMPRKKASEQRNWALEFPDDEEMQALMAELDKPGHILPGADEDFVFTL